MIIRYIIEYRDLEGGTMLLNKILNKKPNNKNVQKKRRVALTNEQLNTTINNLNEKDFENFIEKEYKTTRSGGKINKKVLQSGSFGTAVKVDYDLDYDENFERKKKTIVIKEIDKKNRSLNLSNLKTELKILNRIKYPLSTYLLTFPYEDNDKILYLPINFAKGGDLFDKILQINKGKLKEVLSVSVLQMIISTYYLHINGVYHMDIKPENYLIDEEGWLLIADFGLGVCLDEGDLCKDEDINRYYATHLVQGTPGYASPRQVNKDLFSSYTSDYHALVVTLVSMACKCSEIGDYIVNYSYRDDMISSEFLNEGTEKIFKNLSSLKNLFEYVIIQPIREKEDKIEGKAEIRKSEFKNLVYKCNDCNKCLDHYPYQKGEKCVNNNPHKILAKKLLSFFKNDYKSKELEDLLSYVENIGKRYDEIQEIERYKKMNILSEELKQKIRDCWAGNNEGGLNKYLLK